MQRLLIALTVFALSGIPALGAVCVAACLPVEGAHHAASEPMAAAPAPDSAHHHGHDSAMANAGPSVAAPADADSRLADPGDCPCCATAAVPGVVAHGVTRVALTPDAAPAFVPGGPHAGVFVAPVATRPSPGPTSDPPGRSPGSPLVLRL